MKTPLCTLEGDIAVGSCLNVCFAMLIIISGILPSSVGSNEVYCNVDFLDIASKQWTSGPNLTTCRYQHSCNLITNPSGQREIVVVGGHNHLLTDCPELNSTEIINVDTYTVRNGTRSVLIYTLQDMR